MNDAVTNWINSTGQWSPWVCLGLFLAGSLLMIWRLESMSASGLEGTVLGTLAMPYCSGLGNLIFAWFMGSRKWIDGALHGDLPGIGASREVMTHCLVNNVTNMTLLIGLPAAIWGMSLAPNAGPASSASPKKKKGKLPADPHRVNRLSLLLAITAAAFFTGVMWALGRDGKLDFSDGLVLVGIVLFWQCFHVFEVLKTNTRGGGGFSVRLLINVALLIAGACAVYVSTSWLVDWVLGMRQGFLSATRLGWLSGWLMVLPNALLAFYYAWRRRPELVYSSQVGDGHICIPLCIGVFALFKPIHVPDFFQLGVWLLAGSAALHFLCVALFGQLPRIVGWLLVAVYGVFLWKGLGGK